MTTSATALDRIQAFRRSKTMFATVELGVFDGKHPADYKELAHLLEKQQEYLNRSVPPLEDDANRSQARRFRWQAPADYKELTRLLKNQQGEYVNTLESGTPPKIRVPGIRIGVIVKGKPGSLKLSGKRLEPKGYDHFRNRS